MAEPEDPRREMSRFYQLAHTWEQHAANLETDDRYGRGLKICAEQLRDIINQWVGDHGV
jgi:hypothetical protein